jgi:pimeloyl-ACP methyl ester carboxylesterase
MRRDAKSTTQRIFAEIWNDDDHGCLTELIGAECMFDDLAPDSSRPTPLRLVDLVNVYKAFVPDLRFRVEAQVRERRTIAVYWSAEGSHCGLELGVRPTRRRIRLGGALLATSAGAGRIACVRGLWDVRGFVQQIGISHTEFEQLLQLGDEEVRLRALHERDGVPILFFPTMSLPGWTTWKRFIEPLRARRPVVSYQLLANRWALEHRPMPATYTLKQETASLRRALHRAGSTGPYDVVGHSAGGTAALDFTLDHPEQVRSLVLIEPGLAWLLNATGALDRRMRRTLRQRIACYTDAITPARYARFQRQTYGEKDYDPRKSPRWRMMCAYRRNMQFRKALFTHTDEPSRLASLRCPVLLIQGRDSDPFHRAALESLRARVEAEFVEMPGGHVPHYGPGAIPFLNLLEQFHRTVSVPASSRTA